MIKNKKEKLMKVLFALSAFISIACVILICYFMLSSGIPAIKEIGLGNFIFGKEWKPSSNIYGIFNMIIGSIYVSGLSMLIGVPLGIFTAVYLAFYCPKKIYSIMKNAVDLMAGVPSIVYGFFGLVAIVPIIQKIFDTNGKGILTASLILALMILPTIVGVCESSLKAVDTSYYEGALALGATKETAIFKCTVKGAKSGILAGVVLAIGRAIGETMAVVMIVGNQPILPENVLSGVRTLTTNIIMEMGYATDLHRDALMATAAVLFVFILIINVSFSLLKRGKKNA